MLTPVKMTILGTVVVVDGTGGERAALRVAPAGVRELCAQMLAQAAAVPLIVCAGVSLCSGGGQLNLRSAPLRLNAKLEVAEIGSDVAIEVVAGHGHTAVVMLNIAHPTSVVRGAAAVCLEVGVQVRISVGDMLVSGPSQLVLRDQFRRLCALPRGAKRPLEEP